ncbi:SUKH-4 family immunity protein [Dactylosporangium sp. NPDC000244]|uniref:SUKH-4 family immunity protein n=1 Tax=Dactylosporangium sp. NPDC000244 TaxID=3154365 RepID=UPI003326A66A
MNSDQALALPTMEELESWAGRGRVLCATGSDVAAWRLPQPAKAALLSSGVPLLDEVVHEVAFRAASTMYRLALLSDGGSAHPGWEYGAVPETGEVRLWSAGGQGDSSFVNSSINQWLCSLHMVGSWLAASAVIGCWRESAEAEEQALAELADLLRRIEAIDPAAIGDGDHEQQFWPAMLDRWLY